jgi:nitroreductase
MASTFSSRDITQSLRWRYATKVFDPHRRIPDEDWQVLEEALVLTPSSYGLQPWVFYVITNRAVRESLVPHSWNQRQVADCSHLVVFAVRKNITDEFVDRFIDSIVEERKIDRSTLAGYRKLMHRDVVAVADNTDWAKLQAYIALGNFMTVAALLKIDTCPMEGFVAERYDHELGLPSQGLTTAVLCAAGYRMPTDKYASLAKVRFPKDQLFVYLD